MRVQAAVPPGAGASISILAACLVLGSGCATTSAQRKDAGGDAEAQAAGERPDADATDSDGSPRPSNGAESPRTDDGSTDTGPPAPPVVIIGAKIFTGAGDPLESGTLLLKDGKIAGIGPSDAPGFEIPEDAERIDAKGRFVTPGIIDTHSHLGVYATPHVWATADGNEISGNNTAHVYSMHGFWPQDPGIERAVRGGATTLQILPGSANLIGGRAFTLKLRPARTAQEMRFPGAPNGLKMACGENPKRVYGKNRKGFPNSRMGNIAGQRAAYISAKRYLESLEKHEQKLAEWREKVDAAKTEKEREALPEAPEPPKRDLGLETLAAVLRGDILVHIHCYRADEMAHMLDLAEEMGFSIRSFHHAVEGFKIADRLAKAGVAASVWADWWGFKLEAYDSVVQNAGLIHAAGGRAIIHSDSEVGLQRLNQEAGKAYFASRRAGIQVSESDAIRWITANPAWALGIDEQTGTLEAGKMADVVIWDGHPLSVYSRAQRVFIDGHTVIGAEQGDHAPWSDFELGVLPVEVPR